MKRSAVLHCKAPAVLWTALRVGEGAYFVGDHGKTSTRFTRAGGFDGGVEFQQVGLLGDGADSVQ